MRRATATSIAPSPRKSSPPSIQNFVPSPIAKATPSWVSRWAAAGYRGATIGDFPTRCKALLDDPTDAYANTQTTLKRRNRQDSVFARSGRLQARSPPPRAPHHSSDGRPAPLRRVAPLLFRRVSHVPVQPRAHLPIPTRRPRVPPRPTCPCHLQSPASPPFVSSPVPPPSPL